MIELNALTAGYRAGVPVVHALDVRVERGRVATLIGANGVGKTTALRAMVGQIKSSNGLRSVDGIDVTRMRPAALLRQGVALVPEGRGVLAGLSVAENIRLGGHVIRSPREVRERFDAITDVFPSLVPRLDVSAGLLSGGEQQMLAIARALMSKPHYVLLDEPSMGLAPKIVQQVGSLLRSLADEQDLGILLVEQNATMALSIADHAYVMEHGQITHSGDPGTLGENDSVRRAYLGIG